MTPDLVLLAWTAALAVIQMLVAVVGCLSQVGLAALAGNREAMPERTGWAGRAERAHRNILESLPLFIAFVLIAHLARRTDPMTLLGEELFFAARLAYAVIYVVGIPWLRTVAWCLSVVGLLLIFVELL
ncbi:MAG: MAPEG family protein [Acetobacteraceae bacterium]|nr:MAPEG family protein [Acetobacteraceae bacterium]